MRHCVSVYVATSPLTAEAQAARIEFRNLNTDAIKQLAVFASPGSFRAFRLPNRLGTHIEVGDRFYVRALLRALTFPQAAFVLALAAGSVRLIEVLPDGPVYTVDVPELPTDAASAAGEASIGDRSPSAPLQGSEGQKVRLRQYARKVDQALRGVLGGLERPLILAAAEPLASICRSVNRYPHLAPAVERRPRDRHRRGARGRGPGGPRRAVRR